MKLKQLACLSLLAGAAVGVSAHAQNTISFTGSAQNQTCVNHFNGSGSGDGTLVMGDANIADFPPGGGVSSKPPVNFTISLSGCAVGARPFANFYHTGSATIDTGDSTLLKGPNNLAVRLYVNDGAQTAIHPATTQPMFPWRHANDPVVVTDAAGDATLTSSPDFPIVAGGFQTFVGYLVDYD